MQLLGWAVSRALLDQVRDRGEYAHETFEKRCQCATEYGRQYAANDRHRDPGDEHGQHEPTAEFEPITYGQLAHFSCSFAGFQHL